MRERNARGQWTTATGTTEQGKQGIRVAPRLRGPNGRFLPSNQLSNTMAPPPAGHSVTPSDTKNPSPTHDSSLSSLADQLFADAEPSEAHIEVARFHLQGAAERTQADRR